jgi:hypothetical protein
VGVQWGHEFFSRRVRAVVKDFAYLALCVVTFAAVWFAVRGVEKL